MHAEQATFLETTAFPRCAFVLRAALSSKGGSIARAGSGYKATNRGPSLVATKCPPLLLGQMEIWR